MSDAATMAAAIEETANQRRARGRSDLSLRGQRLEPGDSDRVHLRNLTKSNAGIRRYRPLG